MIGMGMATAHADGDSTSAPALDGLLHIAATNLTDASNVLSPDVDDISQLAGFVGAQQAEAMLADGLLTSENYLDSVANSVFPDESLSNLLDQIFFIPLDQAWVHDSEAVLDAANTLDIALANQDAGLSEALSELDIAQFQMGVTTTVSLPVFFVDELFGGDVLGL
jgi:hypothetical protein